MGEPFKAIEDDEGRGKSAVDVVLVALKAWVSGKSKRRRETVLTVRF